MARGGNAITPLLVAGIVVVGGALLWRRYGSSLKTLRGTAGAEQNKKLSDWIDQLTAGNREAISNAFKVDLSGFRLPTMISGTRPITEVKP